MSSLSTFTVLVYDDQAKENNFINYDTAHPSNIHIFYTNNERLKNNNRCLLFTKRNLNNNEQNLKKNILGFTIIVRFIILLLKKK